MMRQVVLQLRGTQTYADQEPDTVELITDGMLGNTPNGWILTYEESALTGMEGVTTTFEITPGCVCLKRSGKLQSEMVFREGVRHDSLYQMEFGALMITVCATSVSWDLSHMGGTVDLHYTIEIEKSAMGTVDYHLQIRPK